VANRKRSIGEKVKPVEAALESINIDAAARESGTASSTLRYDLEKVKEALPDILINKRPGPKVKNKPQEIYL